MNSTLKLFRFFYIFIGVIGSILFSADDLVAQQSKDEIVLTSSITRHQLDTTCAWFGVGYAKYFPNDSVIQLLKAYAPQLKFTILIGTWCSDSKEHVPPFFKVCDQLGVKEDCIQMIGLTRKKDRVLTPELKRLKVEFVPTFIVYKNGKEVGRIIEDTKVSIESDLLQILSRKKRLGFLF